MSKQQPEEPTAKEERDQRHELEEERVEDLDPDEEAAEAVRGGAVRSGYNLGTNIKL